MRCKELIESTQHSIHYTLPHIRIFDFILVMNSNVSRGCSCCSCALVLLSRRGCDNNVASNEDRLSRGPASTSTARAVL